MKQKKLQCERCGQAKKDEALYYFDGEILCRYCIVETLCGDSSHYCEYIGAAGGEIENKEIGEKLK